MQAVQDNKFEKSDISCWVISEGMAGTENQCVAVAEALGIDYTVKRLSLRQPWKSLSPYLGFEQSFTFTPPLCPPWPDIVIASGRKSIAASRYIKRKNSGKTFTVQIQDPRIDPKHFDLVAVPAHDPTRGPNVIVTNASPNRITLEKLATAKAACPDFASLPAPRVAVLIGGSSKAYTLTSQTVKKLAAQLNALETGLMVTASRRTGQENEAILKHTLAGDNIFFWNGQGENPYFGMLAWADYIMVSADSASMLSDACSTGKPVYMIPLEGGHPRIDKLHARLQDLGALRIFDGRLEPFSYEPLNDAQMIADVIKERMQI